MARDARKAFRLRATRPDSARRDGGARAPGSSARREGGCKFNAVEPDGRPKKIALIADGFNYLQPTVGQKQSVTVKAMDFYGSYLSTRGRDKFMRFWPF